MTEASATGHASSGAPGSNLSLVSTQLSWMRSDLANLRTLLAWARTSVSMIGFGFTIYNFYRGFLEDPIWNFWSINKGLVALDSAFPIPQDLKQRWLYSYVLAGVLTLIGLITLLFMLRVI